MSLLLIDKLLNMVVQYGLTEVKDSIFYLNKDEITFNDLVNLEQQFKRPETYFEDKH